MTEDTSKTVADNQAAAKEGGRDGQEEGVREVLTKKEIGGRGGLEPTRYGDWEKDGRCIDF